MRLIDVDFDDKKDWIKTTDLDNWLDIHDKDGKLCYNLNQTVYVNIPESSKLEYACTTDCYWPLISYKLYGTTRLAWLLMKLNEVKPSQMFDIKHAGDKIIYVSMDIVKDIVSEINLGEDY